MWKFTIKLKETPNFNIPSLLINKHALFVKDVSAKFNDNNYYLRLAVRFPKENKLLVNILENELNNF